MGASVFSCYNLTFYATLTESRTDDYSLHVTQLFRYVRFVQFFAVDKYGFHPSVVICSGMSQTLDYAFVGILQVVFSDKCNTNYLSCFFPTFQEIAPRSQLGCDSRLYSQFFEYYVVQSLTLHVDRYFVDAWEVLTLNDGCCVHVAEVCYFCLQIFAEFVFGTQNQYFGLNTQSLQLLHAGLCGFGFQFARCCKIGYVSQVHIQSPLWSQFPSQLSYCLKKWLTLDVTDGSANLRNDEVERLLRCVQQDAPFYLIGNMRHYLDSFTQVVTSTFPFYHTQIYPSRRHTVVASRLYSCEPLIVSQVKVGLHSIGCYVALSVFVRVECPRVDVDVRVELLNSNAVAPRLQEFSQRS